MEKWSYRSLEWIHKVREENYERSKGKEPEEILKEIVTNTSVLIRDLNLKVIHPKEVISSYISPISSGKPEQLGEKEPPRDLK
jgi:hypothetical protein